ncbi:MAG: hydroxymethylglutaryl-CoA reductase (NADPH) [Crenarchaeota archaeon]|nr:hydroxymethylglutaryl-CoA reductase (NADPH) [Thermoproteota archaeon]
MEKLVDDVINGRVKMHELEKILGNANAATYVRRKVVERLTGVELKHVGYYSIDFNEVVGKNCENTIGIVQVPLAVAGPLKVDGRYAKGSFYIPLATTEGALVASINRGCRIVTDNGGVKTIVIEDYMSRAPVFRLRSIDDVEGFIRWIDENFENIKREAESTSRHARLIRIDKFVLGNNVWLRFRFRTGDAMGMNMVTIAVDKAVRYILENFPEARLVALSGNMCVDKKPSALNMILGRGKTVIAEARIGRTYLKERLGVAPEDVLDVVYRKNLLGSAYAASYGYNAHFANIIAAIFLATGQDMAQVVESSIGFSWAEIDENDNLYFTVTLPSLEIGTVGGGTRLPTQQEALKILGVAGPGDPPGTNALKFAEIIAAAVLAGELNLLIALARNELARAHERLGRGKRE